MSKFPAFTVQASETGTASIHWTDEKAGRRFHIWLRRDDKTPEDTFHSNPLDPAVKHFGRGGHRLLDATAAKWAPMIAHFAAEVAAGDLVAKARAADKAKREAKIAAAWQARAAAVRNAITDHAQSVGDRERAGHMQAMLEVAGMSDADMMAFAGAVVEGMRS